MFYLAAAIGLLGLTIYLYPIFRRNSAGTSYEPQRTLLNFALPICAALAVQGFLALQQVYIPKLTMAATRHSRWAGDHSPASSARPCFRTLGIRWQPLEQCF